MVLSEAAAKREYSKINYQNKDREKVIKKDINDEFKKIDRR